MTKNITEMTGGELAEWLHNTYEKISKQVNWKTQQNCQVPFERLPENNKKVMLRLAQAIQLELAAKECGYRRVQDE